MSAEYVLKIVRLESELNVLRAIIFSGLSIAEDERLGNAEIKNWAKESRIVLDRTRQTRIELGLEKAGY